ncbi:hypothetical protein VTN00DRAFT_4768 [Thermoascus crustaceus]|uniref:uncharacterized protein n=1 Tax=Thermoascus crustaceus TaxID=5088 RepID=UPI003742C543
MSAQDRLEVESNCAGPVWRRDFPTRLAVWASLGTSARWLCSRSYVRPAFSIRNGCDPAKASQAAKFITIRCAGPWDLAWHVVLCMSNRPSAALPALARVLQENVNLGSAGIWNHGLSLWAYVGKRTLVPPSRRGGFEVQADPDSPAEKRSPQRRVFTVCHSLSIILLSPRYSSFLLKQKRLVDITEAVDKFSPTFFNPGMRAAKTTTRQRIKPCHEISPLVIRIPAFEWPRAKSINQKPLSA